MLKTKLAYMALGAIIASLGYFIGTLNDLKAEDDVARVKELIVNESIFIIGADGVGPGTILSPGRILIRGGSDRSSGAISIDADNIHMFSNQQDKGKLGMLQSTLANTPLSSNWIRLSTQTDAPFIDIQKAKGKKITLALDNQAAIKLSNGGLKSKTVNVD